VIAALLSEVNRWINGQRIEVSGGMALYEEPPTSPRTSARLLMS
jgi:hypothetical protein